jgi:hypothetical protein
LRSPLGGLGGETPGMRTAHRSHRSIAPRSAFAGFRFPSAVIVLAVRWYLRFGLSYRDLEELLAERGVDVDHVTIYRWVQRFTRRRPASSLVRVAHGVNSHGAGGRCTQRPMSSTGRVALPTTRSTRWALGSAWHASSSSEASPTSSPGSSELQGDLEHPDEQLMPRRPGVRGRCVAVRQGPAERQTAERSLNMTDRRAQDVPGAKVTSGHWFSCCLRDLVHVSLELDQSTPRACLTQSGPHGGAALLDVSLDLRQGSQQVGPGQVVEPPRQ